MNIVTADAGKCNTKAYAYLQPSEGFPYGSIREYKRRTRISPGDFRDNLFSEGTLIAQINDGEVQRIGRGAIKDPDHITSKMQEVHKNSILTAIARNLGPGEHNVTACICMPFDEAKSVEKRIAFRDFVFGEAGAIQKVVIKDTPESIPYTVKFKCDNIRIYAEGAGITFVYPIRFQKGVNAAVDIGQQNATFLYVNNQEIEYSRSFSTNQGASFLMASLINRLARELNAELDENVVLNAIAAPSANRTLFLRNSADAEKSRIIINECIDEYVESLRQKMLGNGWPIDFMNFTFSGGVPYIIRPELIAKFGYEKDDELAIPEKRLLLPPNSDMMNARGMLYMAASRDKEIRSNVANLLPFPEGAKK